MKDRSIGLPSSRPTGDRIDDDKGRKIDDM